MFSVGGLQSLTATALADSALTGTRRNISVEGPVEVQCIPESSPLDDATSKPWGSGATFSGLGGVRFQYLIHSRAIGRPGVILNLDWPVEESPEGVQSILMFPATTGEEKFGRPAICREQPFKPKRDIENL